MPPEEISPSRLELRQQRRRRMEERIAELSSDAFTLQTVAPRVPELEGARQPASATEVVWARATGRLTIRYVFPRGVIVYGKFYDDGLGLRAFEGLRALRRESFGTASDYQVAEPLHFDEPTNMLLLRQAEGVPLIESLDSAPLEEALRQAELAASWLAKFHRTVLPSLETEPPCERVKLFKLADTLAKAAAANPTEADPLLNLLQRIRELAPSPDGPSPLAAVHGQFTPANVFVAGARTTVIDLDRVCYSDPALDVALFVYRVLHHGMRTGALERARAIVSSFEARYRRDAADNLVNLGFYCAQYCLKGWARFLKVPQAAGDEYKRQMQFYLGELAESLRRLPAAVATQWA